MQFFFDLGDRYARQSDWRDFALTKFCLCAMGVLLGVNVGQKYKKAAAIAASGVFLATYIPLMTKVFAILMEMTRPQKRAE